MDIEEGHVLIKGTFLESLKESSINSIPCFERTALKHVYYLW